MKISSLNSIKYLFVVFSLLLVGVVGFYIYDRTQQTTENTTQIASKPLFSNFNMEALNKITLKTKDKSVELTLQDNVWKVNGKNADEKQVKNLIEALKETKTYDLVSKNPDNHKDMSIDAEAGKEIDLEQGSNKASVVVGNSAGLGNTFFIRKLNENEVYLSRGNLGNIINMEVNYWRDKKISNISFDKLTKVEVTGNKNMIISKSAEGKWIKNQQYNDTQLNDENINNLKTAFSPLEGYAFATEDETKSYNDSWEKITFRLLDAENNELSKFETAKIEDNYIVKKSDDTDLLKVYSSKLNFIIE
jgi:hypothetical protein